MLIVGEKELKNNTVSIRKRFEGNVGIQPLPQFIKNLLEEKQDRRLAHRKEKATTE